MKKLLLKLLLFSTLIFGSLIFLNFLYIRTETYETSNEVEKFYNMPYDLEIVNLGSSHGLYAFDWSQVPVNGFNFALNSQDFYYDLKLLEKFSNHLAKDAIIVIPVSYFSFSIDRHDKQSDFYRVEQRYYSILSPQEIYNFKMGDYLKNSVLPILSAGGKLKALLKDSPPENNLFKKINVYEYSQLSEKGKERAQYHLDLIKKDNYPENINYLKAIIKYCQNKGFRPVLVTTPFTEWYFKNFPDEFLQEFYSLVNSIAIEYDIPYFDYSQDPFFMRSPELFLDTDHLNLLGRQIFTVKFFNDLKNLLKK